MVNSTVNKPSSTVYTVSNTRQCNTRMITYTDYNRLKNENNLLHQNICELKTYIHKMSVEKDDITQLKDVCKQQKDDIHSLKQRIQSMNTEITTLKQHKNFEKERMQHIHDNYSSSWEITELQRKVQLLTKEVNNKNEEIHDLKTNESKLINQINSFSLTSQQIEQSTTNEFNTCNTIANRMIDLICQTIPQWNSSDKDVILIRQDPICMMENIERILTDLSRFYTTYKNSPSRYELNQEILRQRNQYKNELNEMNSVHEDINYLYSLFIPNAITTSDKDKIQFCTAYTQTLLRQTNCSCIVKLTKTITNWKMTQCKDNEETSSSVNNNSILYTDNNHLKQQIKCNNQQIQLLHNAINRAAIVLSNESIEQTDYWKTNDDCTSNMTFFQLQDYCSRQENELRHQVCQISNTVDLLISKVQLTEYQQYNSKQSMETAIDQLQTVINHYHEDSLQTELKRYKTLNKNLRTKNEAMKQTFEDMVEFLNVYNYDIKHRPDQYNISKDDIATLYKQLTSTLRTLSVPFYPSQWTTNDTLLILNRLVEMDIDKLRSKKYASYSIIEQSSLSSMMENKDKSDSILTKSYSKEDNEMDSLCKTIPYNDDTTLEDISSNTSFTSTTTIKDTTPLFSSIVKQPVKSTFINNSTYNVI